MATVAEINAAISQLNDAVAAERAEVLSDLTDLKGQIQALKDQIAAGSPASQADLDAIAASVGDSITRVQGIITDADK